MQINEEVLREYAETMDKKKALEDKLDALNKVILDTMKENKVEKLQQTFGTFSLSQRKSYKFSQEVESLKKKQKEQEEKEKEDGTATVSITEYLRFQ